MMVARASHSDLSQVSSLYRLCFPKTQKSILGQHCCEMYFHALHNHSSYRVELFKDDQTVKGFLVLHLDMTRSLGHRWKWGTVVPMLQQPSAFLRVGCQWLPEWIKTHCSLAIRPRDPHPLDLHSIAYIDFIGVSPHERGRGIGKELIRHAIQLARDHRKAFLLLSVFKNNTQAIELYNTLGFQKRSYVESRHSYIYQIPLQKDPEQSLAHDKILPTAI